MANRAERRALQFQPFSQRREVYKSESEWSELTTGIQWQICLCYERDSDYADERRIPSNQHWSGWEHQFDFDF